MFKLFRITGNSLDPEIKEGDFVLVTRIPFLLNSLKIGDMIVFKHPDHGTLIKLITGIEDNQHKISFVGTNAFSLDSRQIGPVDKDAIIGRVLIHFPRTTRRVS